MNAQPSLPYAAHPPRLPRQSRWGILALPLALPPLPLAALLAALLHHLLACLALATA